MKAHGNSSIKQCTDNLLRIVKGEVPYLRDCGVPLESVDKPLPEGKAQMDNDINDLITKYEPRAVITNDDD